MAYVDYLQNGKSINNWTYLMIISINSIAFSKKNYFLFPIVKIEYELVYEIFCQLAYSPDLTPFLVPNSNDKIMSQTNLY